MNKHILNFHFNHQASINSPDLHVEVRQVPGVEA